MKMKVKNYGLSIIVLILLAAGWALIISTIITGHLWEIDNIQYNLSNMRIWTTLNRAYILFFVFVYVGLHFIFPIKKMYAFIFEKRWIIGIVLLLFLTINKYHGDSIGIYYNVIQPGEGSEASLPILGEIRGIRSDEFIVDTPSVLASTYGTDAFGKYNDIQRGTETLNIVNGVYGGYATLGYLPWRLAYLILPVEYAFSFCWFAPIILGFLVVTELFYIVTQKRKLLSAMGAFLIVCSSFYLWWRFNIYFVAGPGTIVCLFYFLNKKAFWQKILFGIGAAVCFSIFITNLYPAWQVPLGYLFLAIGIWVLYENRFRIKELKVREWAVFLSCFIFMLSMILSYFAISMDYIQTISATSYPGDRIDTGSLYLKKLFYYSQAPFYAYQDIGNASEAGVFFSLFPIPTIMAIYILIKQRKKDLLLFLILLSELPMIIYVTIGYPEIVAKLLLFSHSTVFRTVDVIGLIQVLLIVLIMSRNKEKIKIPFIPALILSVATSGISIWASQKDYPNFLSTTQSVVMFVVIMLFALGLTTSLKTIKEKENLPLAYAFIVVSLFTSLYVRPVAKGLDAIYDKPVAKKIMEIQNQNPNAKWITLGAEPYLSAFSIACGAPTINSTNTYPNLDLWERLDCKKQFEDIYNRYAHVSVELVNDDTQFELLVADSIKVKLSYEDLVKTDADYLLVSGEKKLDVKNDYVKFEKQYEEKGMSIYKILYL